MYVYNELRGMWYQIKQKQQKIPKARANIHVYSSTPCSGLIIEDEMICIPRTARYVIRIKANSRRCQKHERTSTYTAVREFPVYFLKTKKLYRMMIPGTAWYVEQNRTGLLVSCYGKAHPCQDGTEAYGERNPALQYRQTYAGL